MIRLFCISAVFALASPLLADAPAGRWKIDIGDEGPVLLLLTFSDDKGVWTAKVDDASEGLAVKPTISEVKVAGADVAFTLVVGPKFAFQFEGMLAKTGKSIKGSLKMGSREMRTIELTPTKLVNLKETFEYYRETFAETESAEVAFRLGSTILKQATAKKLTAEDVRAVLDHVAKLAAAYGKRWERHTLLRLAESLVGQDGFAEVAVAQARKAERMLTDEDEMPVRLATLELLARSLTAAKKPADAKPYQEQIAKMEAREYAEWAKTNPAYKVEPFAGRKEKSDRVVLVELISSTDVAMLAKVDQARDGLLKAYGSKDAIVLTYHVPVKNDTNPLVIAETRQRLSPQALEGGQFAFVAGKPVIEGEKFSALKDGETLFKLLAEKINAELEAPAKVKLALTVKAEADGFAVKAAVSELATPGEKMKLKFALVEERIRHLGANDVKFHAMVVRAMPGGAAGFPLAAATAEQTVTIKPAEIRAALIKYIAERSEDLPMAHATLLTNLKLIAFVQNEATGEILSAATVDLK